MGLQLAFSHISGRQTHHVTYNVLKRSAWMQSRDVAMSRTSLLVIQIPTFAALRCSRADRQVMSHIDSYLNIAQDRQVVLFDLAGSNAWEHPTVRHYPNQPGMHTSIHNACSWNVRDPSTPHHTSMFLSHVSRTRDTTRRRSS